MRPAFRVYVEAVSYMTWLERISLLIATAGVFFFGWCIGTVLALGMKALYGMVF